MGNSHHSHNMQPAKIDHQQSTSSADPSTPPRQSHDDAIILQFDGPYDQPHNTTVGSTSIAAIQPAGLTQQHPTRPQHHTHPPPRLQARATQSAANDLLPYCTMTPPLDEAQVIALSDVAGSLREVVLLALGALSGDPNCIQILHNAVGEQAASGIAEFFMEEWELDG
ncbi:hypothetical protein T440DRAFT_220490 [Plenodomus tracheiphilus IPT5]|uniref:Uncharacterized protein n=1 Tax=Plenodomus tracheiphilus IPT5 TaxID=1408161 RepID=A0A6A7AUU9_9PLEO|nr:hypothetical protein T440DRAFT_220490 [Plenodomus tracheiphilus IPT5]